MFVFIKSLNSASLNISLLNLIGMACDHWLAILRPLHYHSIMTRRRVSLLILIFWILALLFGFSDFFTGIQFWQYFREYYNFCEIVWLTPYQDEYVTFALALGCFGLMSVIYWLIYRKVKSRDIASQSRANNAGGRREKKALVTTLLIVGTFVLCWLPMCLFQLTLITIVKLSPETLQNNAATLRCADQFLFDLLLLNCIADPIIYAVRIQEIRLGYKRLCCFLCFKHQLTRQASRNTLVQKSLETCHTALMTRSSIHSQKSVFSATAFTQSKL